MTLNTVTLSYTASEVVRAVGILSTFFLFFLFKTPI